MTNQIYCKQLSCILMFFMLSTLMWPSITLGELPPLPGWPHCSGCNEINRTLLLTSPYLKGSDVEELQQRLEDLGFSPGKIDGIYGPETYQAVIEFQRQKGLEPTGQVDTSTWDALGEGVEVPADFPKASPTGRVSIVIDREKQRLYVYEDGRFFAEYPVAVGKSETPTPVGEWKITSKSSGWGGGFGTRWLGLNVPWGIYGIHGTNKPWSIGQRASAGCIRMHNKHVEEIFPWIPLGTPVKVIGQLPPLTYRKLRPGTIGSDVVHVQFRLKELGYYWGFADGRYGRTTQLAVKYFQAMNLLPPTGLVDEAIYQALGL